MIGPATSYSERIVTPLAGIEYPWSYVCTVSIASTIILFAGRESQRSKRTLIHLEPMESR